MLDGGGSWDDKGDQNANHQDLSQQKWGYTLVSILQMVRLATQGMIYSGFTTLICLYLH